MSNLPSIEVPRSLKSMNNDELKKYEDVINSKYHMYIRQNNNCYDQEKMCIEEEFTCFMILDLIKVEKSNRNISIKNTKKKMRNRRTLTRTTN